MFCSLLVLFKGHNDVSISVKNSIYRQNQSHQMSSVLPVICMFPFQYGFTLSKTSGGGMTPVTVSICTLGIDILPM